MASFHFASKRQAKEIQFFSFNFVDHLLQDIAASISSQQCCSLGNIGFIFFLTGSSGRACTVMGASRIYSVFSGCSVVHVGGEVQTTTTSSVFK